MIFSNDSNWYYWPIKLILCSLFSVSVIFYTVWIVKVIKHLFQSIRLYRGYNGMDFRDKREQDRILYNCETHIVKDVILTILSCAEVGEVFCILCSAILTTLEHRHVQYPIKTNQTSVDCSLTEIVIYPSNDFLKSILLNIIKLTFQDFITATGSVSFLLLLSFLTQYMSKRYLHHSYTKSIFNHLLLFIAQLTILVLLCNLEIHILFFLLAPWFILIDWIILVRNSISLRNVLKSNVRDLKLTSSILYIEQYKLSQIYSVFMPVLLTALFFGALTVLFHHYSLILRIIFVVPCLSSSISMFGKRNSVKSHYIPFQNSLHWDCCLSIFSC